LKHRTTEKGVLRKASFTLGVQAKRKTQKNNSSVKDQRRDWGKNHPNVCQNSIHNGGVRRGGAGTKKNTSEVQATIVGHPHGIGEKKKKDARPEKNSEKGNFED